LGDKKIIVRDHNRDLMVQRANIIFSDPGAKRIMSASSRSQLLTTAFLNEDRKIAVIIMNQSNLKITYNLCIGHNAAEVKILPHSIQTLVLL